MSEHILSQVRNRTGFLTLNRPQALNSLSLDMVRTITVTLLGWRDDPAIDTVVLNSTSERAFCAGGDIRFFYQAGQQLLQQGSALVDDFFTEEYALNHLIHHYPKTYIVLMDGIVMGGGMGIAQSFSPGRIRVATERTKMAMPEVGIGLFPDVGGSYFLSRSPGQIGTYLALTGNIIGANDAIYAGLADIFIPSNQLATLAEMLAASPSQDKHAVAVEFSRQFQADDSASILATERERIDSHFAFDDVSAIVASLSKDTSPFAQATLNTMQKRSPLMMSVTLEQLRRGARLDFAHCLRMERTMVRHSFEGREVLEGIRATVIDKDMNPAWSPARLEDVSREMVERFFQSTWPEYIHPLRSWL